jgi:hypothetical protein
MGLIAGPGRHWDREQIQLASVNLNYGALDAWIKGK